MNCLAVFFGPIQIVIFERSHHSVRFSRYARSRPSASLNIDKIFSKRSQMFVIEQKDELLRLIWIDLLIAQSKHLHPQPNALTTTCATRSSQNKLKTSNLERIHHFTRCSTRVLSALEPISCLNPKFRRALQIRNIRYDFYFPGFPSLCRLRNVKQLLHGLVSLRQYSRKSLQIVANSSDSQWIPKTCHMHHIRVWFLSIDLMIE